VALQISLNDDQLTTITKAAEALHPRDRTAFMKAVAARLQDQVIGNGIIGRLCRELQAQFLRPPS